MKEEDDEVYKIKIPESGQGFMELPVSAIYLVPGVRWGIYTKSDGGEKEFFVNAEVLKPFKVEHIDTWTKTVTVFLPDKSCSMELSIQELIDEGYIKRVKEAK